MGGDSSNERCWMYAETQGTTLDLAFRDRVQMWTRLMRTSSAWLNRNEDRYCCLYDDRHCEPPGTDYDWQAVEEVGLAAYDWTTVARYGRGPDGNGEDKLIKSPEDLLACSVEVVSSLVSLELFGWETTVTPMPSGVFDALLKLKRSQACT